MKFIVILIALAVANVLAEKKMEEKYMEKNYMENYKEKNMDNNKEKNYMNKDMEKYTEKYTDKYDSMDLDAMMENKRLMQAYSKCVLEQGKCTAEGKELKSHISEALQNGCAKCTDAQHKGMKRVIKHYMQNEPETWQQMVDKYDPSRTYTKKYEKELKNMQH